jgi:PleD family two-component response regulator
MVTISTGLGLSTDFGNCGVDDIIQAANAALYEAKAGERNCQEHPATTTDIAQKEVTSFSR